MSEEEKKFELNFNGGAGWIALAILVYGLYSIFHDLYFVLK